MARAHGIFKVIIIIFFSSEHADTALCQKGVGLIRLLFGQHQYFHSGRQIQCTVETCGSCSYDNDIVIFFHFCFLVPVDAGFSVGFCIFMFSDL